MNLKIRKYIFFAVWLFILTIPVYTVLKNTPLSGLGKDPLLILNFLQRLSGLLLFTLLFIQITLGSLLGFWVQLIGAKAYWLHITEGVVIYALALFHPLMEMVITYNISGNLVNTLAVLIPKINSQREVYLTYAKAALVLLTLSVAAGYFRTNPVFRKYWLSFHILNYFVFYLVFFHMRIGSDIMTPPFIYLSWVALAVVSYTALRRLIHPFLKVIKSHTGETNIQKA